MRLVLAAHRSLGPDANGHPRLHLTVVGGGSRESRVRALVANSGAGVVVDVRGRLPRAELPELYARCHLFVSPARLEAFGIAALEARACGLPVLAARDTGPSTFLRDRADALLVGSGRDAPDAAVDTAMSAALVALVTHPEKVAELLDTARGELPPSGWPVVLDACSVAYGRAVARAGRPRTGTH